jgi:hypothetical protein
MVEFIVNGQLIPMMQAWGHDINPETDRFAFDAAFELSLQEHYNIVDRALNYFDIPTEWISKTFNIPITGVKAIPENTLSAKGLAEPVIMGKIKDIGTNFR